ncbi:hypothetical protein ACU4GD_40390 [Cupriavidus basilensis]
MRRPRRASPRLSDLGGLAGHRYQHAIRRHVAGAMAGDGAHVEASPTSAAAPDCSADGRFARVDGRAPRFVATALARRAHAADGEYPAGAQHGPRAATNDVRRDAHGPSAESWPTTCAEPFVDHAPARTRCLAGVREGEPGSLMTVALGQPWWRGCSTGGRHRAGGSSVFVPIRRTRPVQHPMRAWARWSIRWWTRCAGEREFKHTPVRV